MVLVLAKVLVSPLLLAGSTYAVHRWGPLVGGLLLGLPLVSAPISALLFAQYGQNFAIHAAYGTLLGFVAAGAFYASYSAVSPVRPWWQSLIVAYGAFFLTAGALSLLNVTLSRVFMLVAVALAALAFAIVVPRRPPAPQAPRKRTLATRMAIAAGIVLAITTLARFLGPELSGFLTPLPVLAAIMAASSQRQSGSDAVHGLLRGAAFGTWGGAAFFSVVIMLAGHTRPIAVYAAAAVMAIMTEIVALRMQAAEKDSERVAVPSVRMPAGVMPATPFGLR